MSLIPLPLLCDLPQRLNRDNHFVSDLEYRFARATSDGLWPSTVSFILDHFDLSRRKALPVPSQIRAEHQSATLKLLGKWCRQQIEREFLSIFHRDAGLVTDKLTTSGFEVF